MASNLGGRPVSVVDAGGAPYVQVSSGAPIATPITSGPPITLVASGAPPIVLVNDDGTAWSDAATVPLGQTLLVSEGDSIISGGTGTYTLSFATQAIASYLGRMPFKRSAVGGSHLGDVEGRAATIDAYLGSLYPWVTNSILVLCVGTNDLAGVGAGPYADNPTTFLAALATYCDARRTAGWKVVLCTILPRGDEANPFVHAVTVNTTIRTWVGTHCDAICDIAADPVMGLFATVSNATYYQGDQLHPTNTGAALLAAVLAPKLWPLTAATPLGSTLQPWNSADKNATVALSASDYAASAATGTWTGCRGVRGRESGKYHLEMRLTGNIDAMMGVGDKNTLLTTYTGGTSVAEAGPSNILGLLLWPGNSSTGWKTGASLIPTVSGFNPTVIGLGDSLVMEINFDTGKIWAGKNGVFAGNPAAGTGENYTFPPNWELFPSARFNNASAVVTLPTTPLYTPSSGFLAW